MKNFYFSLSFFNFRFIHILSIILLKDFGVSDKYNLMFLASATCLRNERKAIIVFFPPHVIFWRSWKEQNFVYTTISFMNLHSRTSFPNTPHSSFPTYHSTANKCFCVCPFLSPSHVGLYISPIQGPSPLSTWAVSGEKSLLRNS